MLGCQPLCMSLPMSDVRTIGRMSIGTRIREAREARNLNQGQLAKQIGIAQASLSLLESGRTASPKGTTLTELARVLRVEPRWILTGRGPMQREDRSGDDPEILQIWESLSRAKRSMLLAAARALRDAEESDESPAQSGERRPHVR